MNIEDLEAELPNGLHDTRIFSFLYVEDERRVEFLAEVWLGDVRSKVYEDRERYAPARIELIGVAHFSVDDPHPKVLAVGSKVVTIDTYEADPAQEYAIKIPAGGFAGRFYVFQWNAFIHFAASDARLTWLGGN